MTRIGAAFRSLSRNDEKGLVVYLTAGDPDPRSSLRYFRAAADAGADILEIGVPFSDPMADGPTIQAASRRALAAGMTVDGVLELLSRFRKTHDTPVVLFGYYNPFFRYGVTAFARNAASAGADGALVVDLPVEESAEMAPHVKKAGMDWIPLASPTSGPERIRMAVAEGSGFLYLISVTGITGARRALPPGIADWTRRIAAGIHLPVAVGFGISTPGMAREAVRNADAAVVGSACVRIVDAHGAARSGPESLRRFVRSLKNELR